jgi:hypothetical protein
MLSISGNQMPGLNFGHTKQSMFIPFIQPFARFLLKWFFKPVLKTLSFPVDETEMDNQHDYPSHAVREITVSCY